MSKSNKFQVQIPTPCTQSWEEMKTIKGGRFCSSCKKEVIDFSLLNDRQIIEILRKNNKTCGRFADEQLTRELVATDEQLNSFIPAVIVSTVLATGMATATYAAPVLPDTTIASSDSIPTINDCKMIGGYSALDDFEVKAYVTVRKSHTVGGIGYIKKAKRISFFRRILIALGLSKRPV